jgi:two-component system nitrogen regulation response regulator GlnG
MTPDRSHVWVLDDDASMRDMLTLALEQAGYAVQSFAQGPAAFAALATAWPAALVLDQRMAPVDGIAFLTHVRQVWGRVPPSVVLTAYLPAHDTRGVAEAARALGVSAVLTKPTDLDTLLDAVAAAVAGGPAP